MAQAMRNYWVCWLERYGTGRPVQVIPHKNVVGWWMDGKPGAKHVYVWIRAVHRIDATVTLMEEWPGVNRAERFIHFDLRPEGWQPCTRFTWQRPWSSKRLRAAVKADAMVMESNKW